MGSLSSRYKMLWPRPTNQARQMCLQSSREWKWFQEENLDPKELISYVSLSFDGSKLDKSFIVPLQDGNTRNISARFLGSILMGTPRSTNSSSSNTLITTFRASLQTLNARPICGEYKLWIYQHYFAPSTHFYLAVNSTSDNAIKKIEACATKALKKWLKLARNATQATLYHPEVLDVPHFSCLKVKAKLIFLVAIDQSTDRLIQELRPLLSVPNIRKGLDIPPKCSSILDSAKESVATLPGIKNHCNKQVKKMAMQQCDAWASRHVASPEEIFRQSHCCTGMGKQKLEKDHE